MVSRTKWKTIEMTMSKQNLFAGKDQKELKIRNLNNCGENYLRRFSID